MRIINPEGWPRPPGYANGVAAHGEVLAIAGQIGWTPDGAFESDALPAQVRQALLNIRSVLQAAGATPEHLVSLTWYVTDMPAYRSGLQEIGAAYREVMGKVFPAMACVAVVELVEPKAKVEIEAVAVIPHANGADT